MNLDHVKYITSLRKKLNSWGLNIMAQDSDKMLGYLDVFLYIRMESGKTIVTQEITLEDTDTLEINIISAFNLEFAYDETQEKIVLGAYSHYYSRLMEIVKFLKDCDTENVSFKYNYPEGTVIFECSGFNKQIYLHELENKDQVVMKLLDLSV